MSIRLMSMAFEHDMKPLKTDKGKNISASTLTILLIALADHANDEGRSIYPGVRRLSAKTKLTQRTVCNAIEALVKAGYLGYTGFSRYGTKEYFINVEILEVKAQFFIDDYKCKSTSEQSTDSINAEVNTVPEKVNTVQPEVNRVPFESEQSSAYTSLNHHLKHNNTIKGNELKESFKTMQRTLFNNTFNPTIWGIINKSEMKLEGKVLKVYVDNPAIVENVNQRSRAVQKQIAYGGLPFERFELVHTQGVTV